MYVFYENHYPDNLFEFKDSGLLENLFSTSELQHLDRVSSNYHYPDVKPYLSEPITSIEESLNDNQDIATGIILLEPYNIPFLRLSVIKHPEKLYFVDLSKGYYIVGNNESLLIDFTNLNQLSDIINKSLCVKTFCDEIGVGIGMKDDIVLEIYNKDNYTELLMTIDPQDKPFYDQSNSNQPVIPSGSIIKFKPKQEYLVSLKQSIQYIIDNGEVYGKPVEIDSKDKNGEEEPNLCNLFKYLFSIDTYIEELIDMINEALKEEIDALRNKYPLFGHAAKYDNINAMELLYNDKYAFPTLDLLFNFYSVDGIKLLMKRQPTYLRDNPNSNPFWILSLNINPNSKKRTEFFSRYSEISHFFKVNKRAIYSNFDYNRDIELEIVINGNYEYLEFLHKNKIEYPYRPPDCYCDDPKCQLNYKKEKQTTLLNYILLQNDVDGFNILKQYIDHQHQFRSVFHACDLAIVDAMYRKKFDLIKQLLDKKISDSSWPIYTKYKKIPFVAFAWFMDDLDLFISKPGFPSLQTLEFKTAQFLDVGYHFLGDYVDFCTMFSEYDKIVQMFPTLSLVDIFILCGENDGVKYMLKQYGLTKQSIKLLEFRTEDKDEIMKIINEFQQQEQKIIEELEGKSNKSKKQNKKVKSKNNNKNIYKKKVHEKEIAQEKEIIDKEKEKEQDDIKENHKITEIQPKEIIKIKNNEQIKENKKVNNNIEETTNSINDINIKKPHNTIKLNSNSYSKSTKLYIRTSDSNLTSSLQSKLNNTTNIYNQSSKLPTIQPTQSSVKLTVKQISTEFATIYDKQIGKFKFNSSDIIGRGSNATLVFRGVWSDRVPVAIKRIVKGFNHLIDKEIEVLIELTSKSSQSSNLVRYIDREEDDNFIYLGLTLCDMSLQQLFEDPTNSELKNSLSSISLINGIVLGVQFLHNNQIVHNDLNPRNILFKDSQLFITDMGLSKMMVESSFAFTHTPSGTGGYYAAEVIKQQRKTSSVDIFSLGCLIYYILSGGKHAFGDDIIMRVPNIIMNRFDLKDITNQYAIDLISWMISFEESNRPSIQTVIKHPFFWNIDDKLKFIDKTHQTIKKYSTTSLNTHNNQTYLKESWDKSIDQNLLSVLNEESQYNFNNVKDLVRCIRNSIHHHQEIYSDLNKKILWFKNQHIAFEYFEKRHPTLLIYLYQYFRDQHNNNTKKDTSNYLTEYYQ
ncbi:putative protein serine/threonine kinase [Heterostelium album PN500]|uniref:non-specific serine/threonine protein kinase n=1 Tax=Heterostelium pallidum (strain ATCC 26659 / Pp 5 / PN500) TaxID=670386 RepID=D3B4Q9_HETP5|nr:putative protein serine/threonine kinase [Heterostelium album PN500]EFA84307.1 putative protein serine/threonine kinase [Heterostelium album PN500]|eukprot:XP_020436422.1 putative protein serine/threonine kinase [Heterostelium album PN500]